MRKMRLILAAIVLFFGGFLNHSYGQSLALEGPSRPGKEMPADVGQILSVVRLVETEYFHPSNEIVLANAALKGIESFLKARKLLAGPIQPVSPSGVADKDLMAFSERYSRIKEQYSARVKEKELVHAAIRGVVSSLKDPYTVFMDSREYHSLTEQMSGGNFGGIGIYIDLEKVKGSKASRLLVGETIEGTPAFRAGLKTGDMIEKINSRSTRGITVEGAQHLIRGPVGTRVTLTVRKKNEPRTIEIVLLRENIRIPSVKHRMLESNVGYVRLRTFGDQTPRELEKAIAELEARGAKGYILDLRNNGGGYITTALSVCSRFLPGGSLIVSVVDRKGRKTSYFADGSMHQ
ncbi:MAG: PDZ domain-containing protein [Armatimonadetes bacterium]|nr:PDZ domain-containing protein [Armatimonadota bacterium]